MLDSLFFTINSIFPLILIVLIGFILKSKKFIDEKFFDYGSKFCFYIALPISLFKSVYTSDFSKINWIFIGYCLIFTIIICVILNRFTQKKQIIFYICYLVLYSSKLVYIL